MFGGRESAKTVYVGCCSPGGGASCSRPAKGTYYSHTIDKAARYSRDFYKAIDA